MTGMLPHDSRLLTSYQMDACKLADRWFSLLSNHQLTENQFIPIISMCSRSYDQASNRTDSIKIRILLEQGHRNRQGLGKLQILISL